MANKPLLAVLILFLLIPSTCWSLKLSELYTMNDNDRLWYLGGIYDTNISNWNDKGITSNCLKKMEFKGFTSKISNFITSLPEDANSKKRKAYDQMNVAAVAWLLIQKECTP